MTTSHKVSNAHLLWDEQGMPRSADYEDIYYSASDAIEESRHVFLAGNQLAQRFSGLQNAASFQIGECGFGGGLNFLNTCRLWCELASPDQQLTYLAFEQHPLKRADMQRLHGMWPEFADLSTALLDHYPEYSAGLHRLHLTYRQHRITLDLWYGDTAQGLQALNYPGRASVQAWFLDGFSPRANPSMWNDHLYKGIRQLSHKGTTLTTYSAAGDVRRQLAAHGFEIERSPGYGNKRHMLKGQLQLTAVPRPQAKPLTVLPGKQSPASGKALIIGGGLAGCASAHALARKGWQVQLVEREPQLANKASGNPRGILNCKTARRADARSHFHLHAFHYALRSYRQMQASNDIDWHECGLLQVADHAREAERQQALKLNALYDDRLCSFHDQASLAELAGLPLEHAGMLLPAAGWLNPHQLCKAYCQHPNIQVTLSTEALSLQRFGNEWQLSLHGEQQQGQAQSLFARGDTVIIAGSMDARAFLQSRHYPLVPNRGQIELYTATQSSQQLKRIISGKAYILPAHEGSHLLGGSSAATIDSTDVLEADRQQNLSLLRSSLPAIAAEFEVAPALLSRAGLRCSTPDYLPVAGPVEDREACLSLFRELRRNARATVSAEPVYEPGLFINVAHGSHGLCTTPIIAEYLASLINGDPIPLTTDAVALLHPLRFMLKNLKRQEAGS